MGEGPLAPIQGSARVAYKIEATPLQKDKFKGTHRKLGAQELELNRVTHNILGVVDVLWDFAVPKESSLWPTHHTTLPFLISSLQAHAGGNREHH